VNRTFAAVAGRVLCGLLAAQALGACDDDPSRPDVPPLTGTPVTPALARGDTIRVQEAIRVAFNRPINPATALDPANFVVINTCTGLRVPGALRLVGDTVVFSPAQALPFLTPLAIRVQNILDVSGGGLAQPITFVRVTERPPVSDLSWRRLDAPTADQITGISFATDDVGYINTFGGTVYRTTNAGTTFAFRFKDVNISGMFSIQALTAESVYVASAEQRGGFPSFGLYRSVNGAASFQLVQTVPEQLSTLELRRVGTRVVGVAGGFANESGLYRFDSQTPAAPLTRATGTPPFPLIFTDADMTPDTTRAIATFFDGVATGLPGAAYRSTNSGRSYTPVTFGTPVPTLFGAGAVSNTSAFVVGDSSTVFRVDLTTGATSRVTQGIPQTTVDAASGTVTTYTFTRVRFAPDGQTGYIVGYLTQNFRDAPDQQVGVLFQTTNGGTSWTRQGIQGAAGNGLAFPPVFNVQVRSATFAAVAGNDGLVAARIGTPAPTGACAFQPQPAEVR
jgi:hypothetical protein